MRIILIGGGVVGSSLAEQLLRDGHTLSLVEQDAKLCQLIGEKLDLQIINGSGSSPDILHLAGIQDANMVLAVTPNNEVNLITCAIAAQFDVPRRIARLRGNEFSETGGLIDLARLGVTSVIHPEEALVDQIIQYIETPGAIESANFEQGRILMRGYQITEEMELTGKTPREIREAITPNVVLFAALVRRGEGMIPDGDTRFEAGDIVYTLFPRESMPRFLSLVGQEHKQNRKIIITGDSFSTLELIRQLDKTEHHVTLVDPSIEHAEKVAEVLDSVEVLHGDCTDADLLRELNVDTASFFVSASDEPDYNMLSALLAKAEGAKEVIAIAPESRHEKLFRSIGIDHVVNPRSITAREILENISRGHIGAVVKLSNVDIEAIRFTVEEDCDVAGMSVKKMARKLKKGSIIGVIVRSETMILPDGETVLETGDHVIMITRHKNLPTIGKLFKPKSGKKN